MKGIRRFAYLEKFLFGFDFSQLWCEFGRAHLTGASHARNCCNTLHKRKLCDNHLKLKMVEK